MMNDKDMRIRGSANENHASESENNQAKSGSLSLNAIGQITGNIARDFNNKLAGIMGFAELALTKIDDQSEVKKYLNNIINRCDQSAKLVQNLLAFSRQKILNMTTVDLNSLVHDSIIFLRNSVQADIEIITDLGYDLPPIYGDSTALDTIIAQFISNANDALEGYGELRFESSLVELDESYCVDHPEINPGNYVKLTITDTGSGISDAVRQHIFEPFFTTKDPQQHQGLGLSVVYGLIKQHSGSIEVLANPRGGTIFQLYFPVLKGEMAGQLVATEQMVEGGSETILLVDDEEDILMICFTTLEQYGYKVLSATNGQEAFRLFQKYGDQINIVVTDIYMPEMNGLELYQKIYDKNSEMKFLFITGYSSESAMQSYINRSNTDLLQKPFKKQDLAVKVRELLNN